MYSLISRLSLYVGVSSCFVGLLALGLSVVFVDGPLALLGFVGVSFGGLCAFVGAEMRG